MFRSERMKKFMGVPEFLPGSELERLNQKVAPVVEVPQTYTKNELR